MFLVFLIGSSLASSIPSHIDLLSKWMELKEDVQRASMLWKDINKHPATKQVREDVGDMSLECKCNQIRSNNNDIVCLYK